VHFKDGDKETMCFKELAPLVYELPEGYVEGAASGRGQPCAPFPKIIGSRILTKKDDWEEAYVGVVKERVGPRLLNDGNRGAVYRVSPCEHLVRMHGLTARITLLLLPRARASIESLLN
jgi:hypothetical protein